MPFLTSKPTKILAWHFFDMLGYLIMPPIIDYFGRVRSLTGSYIITSSAIIISSLLTYFDVAGVGMLCRILGQYINHTTW